MFRLITSLAAAIATASAACGQAADNACEFRAGEVEARGEADALSTWVLGLTRLSSVADRVVGGNRACDGDWPYFAAFRRVEGAHLGYYCGGTAISENWVLTAAHCVARAERREDGFWGAPELGRMEVVLGEIDVAASAPEAVFQVTEVRVHPGYRAYSRLTGEAELNDVALVRLDRPWRGATATLSGDVLSDGDRSSGRGFVAGFGVEADPDRGGARRPFPRRDGGPQALAGSRYLLQAVVPMITPDACRRTFAAHDGGTKICAGYETGGRDTCQGDSGGPLVALDRNARPYQTGVVSYGIGCAEAGRYAVYTRISAFRDWIVGIAPAAKFVSAQPETNRDAVRRIHDAFMTQVGASRDRVSLRLLPGEDFLHGELLEFTVESDIAGRLMVLDLGAGGDVTQLYPNPFSGADGSAGIAAGERVRVPDGAFRMPARADPPGEGRLIAIVMPEDAAAPVGYIPNAADGLQSKEDPVQYAMNLVSVFERLALEPDGSGGFRVADGWAFTSANYTISR